MIVRIPACSCSTQKVASGAPPPSYQAGEARRSQDPAGVVGWSVTAEPAATTLEFEMAPGAAWRTAADAEPELHQFIEGYYNARRLHSRNQYRSPNEAEADWRRGKLAA